MLRDGLFQDFPEGKFVDDDYISGVAASHFVKIYAVPGPMESFYANTPLQSTEANALSSGSNKETNIQRQSELLTRFVTRGWIK